ncbi:MAG: FAD-binding oxidoreductase [Leptospirales bacterium]
MNITQKKLELEGIVYKPSKPFEATLVESTRITGADSPDDIRHLLIEFKGSGIHYKEGQSIGVIVPGEDERGKRNRPRLYSIASARGGEGGQEGILALTVKRVIFTDEETGKIVKGLASNYLCDLTPGEKLLITGPVGRTFILPEDDTTDLIMVAVGTGIAPFRAFLHHIYKERKSWNGNLFLFFGAKTGMEAIYMNDENNDIGQYYEEETFKAFQALSRSGEKKYVQHSIEENQEAIWETIEKKNFSFYLCGLKGVEEGINDLFEKVADSKGKNWEEMREEFKQEKRWHIEVY